MKKLIYIFIVLFSVGIFNSCSKFLEPQSQSEFMPETAEQLSEMLLGVGYPAPTSSDDMMCLLEVLNDDVTCRAYFTPDAGNFPYDDKYVNSYFSVFTWQPDYSIVMETNATFNNNMYGAYYKKIYAPNAVLDYINKVSGTKDEMNDVMAQAYALRAYYYFQLVNIYGAPYNYNKKALGVPLKLTSSIEQRNFTRNTVEEVYNQVISDIDSAEILYKLLPTNKQFRKNYRTSLPMVNLLQSRINLYVENWEKAAEYAEKVIQDPAFSLIDLNNLPAPGTTELQYNFMTYNNPENIWVFGSAADMYSISGYRLLAGSGNNKLPALFQSSPSFLSSFQTGDLRKTKYITPEYVNKTQYRAFGKYSINKNSYTPITGYTYFGQAFRLSEAYLNYAEAMAHLNKNGSAVAAQKAIDALNTLRKKRFTTATYTDLTYTGPDDLIELVKAERRREMCFEGQRWFDLRRYGMPQIQHNWIDNSTTVETYTLLNNDPGYTLPLPQSVIEQNPSLEQNPLAPNRTN